MISRGTEPGRAGAIALVGTCELLDVPPAEDQPWPDVVEPLTDEAGADELEVVQ